MEQNIGKLSALDKVQALKKEKEKEKENQQIDMEIEKLTQQKQELESSLASIRGKRLDNINGQRQAVKELKSSKDTENILDDNEVKADIFNDDDQELETLKTEENNIRQNIQELDAQISKLQGKDVEVLTNVSEQQPGSGPEEELQQEEKQVEGEKSFESQESTLEQPKEEQTQSVEEKTEAQENKDKKKQYEHKLQEILSFEVKYPYLMSEPIRILSDSENKIVVSFPEKLQANFQRTYEISGASRRIEEKIEKLNKTLRSSKKWYQSEAKFNDAKMKAREERTNLENKLNVYNDNVRSYVEENKVLKELEILEIPNSDIWEILKYCNVRFLPAELNSLKTLVDKAKEFYTKKIENHQ